MAELYYHDGFHGSYQIGNQTLSIGKDAIMPYDMTYGAIASCLYAAYLGIAKAKDVYVRNAHVSIDGRKRTTVPTTLEYLSIHMVVDTDAEEEAVKACMDQAILNCSMVQTFARVAEIDYSVEIGEAVEKAESQDAPACSLDSKGC